MARKPLSAAHKAAISRSLKGNRNALKGGGKGRARGSRRRAAMSRGKRFVNHPLTRGYAKDAMATFGPGLLLMGGAYGRVKVNQHRSSRAWAKHASGMKTTSSTMHVKANRVHPAAITSGRRR